VNYFCELCSDLGFDFNVSQHNEETGWIKNKVFQRKRTFTAYLCLGNYNHGGKEQAYRDFLNLIKPTISRKKVKE